MGAVLGTLAAYNEGMDQPTFPSAIVLVQRTDLFDAFRQELKELKVPAIIAPEGLELTTAALEKYPGALFVVDWSLGVGKVTKLLAATQQPLRSAIRPIFLFSVDEADELDGVAAEYSVTRVYRGQITRNIIRENLSQIAAAEILPEAIRDAYVAIQAAAVGGDEKTAGLLLAKLHTDNPGLPRVAQDYAEYLFASDDFVTALSVVTPLAALPDASPRSLNLLGRIQLKAGQFDDASVTLNRAKLINPFNIDRLCALGDAFLNLDMFDHAKEAFETALKHDPKGDEAVGGMGKTLLLNGDINDALVFMKQLSGPREMASVFNSAAVIAMRGKRYGEGSNLYNVALRTVGTDPKVLSKLAYNMGIGFYRKKDIKTAHECFAIAVKLDERNKKAKTNYDMHLAKLGAVTISEEKTALIERLMAINTSKGHLAEAGANVDEAS